MARTQDTLPPAERDQALEYLEGHRAARCRMRVYRTREDAPVVVLTELDDNPGPSITNAAEWAHYAACELLGFPWPCTFIEHYPGGDGFEEHTDLVEFRPGPDGHPAVDDGCFGKILGWRPLPLEDFHRMVGATESEVA